MLFQDLEAINTIDAGSSLLPLLPASDLRQWWFHTYIIPAPASSQFVTAKSERFVIS
jgi:hypothetical protein